MRHNLDGCAFLPLLQTLTTAQNDTKPACHGSLRLCRHKVIRFSENRPTLGVAKYGPVDASVFKLLDRHLPGEGAIGTVKHILSSDLHRIVRMLACEEEVERRWCNDNFGVGIWTNESMLT